MPNRKSALERIKSTGVLAVVRRTTVEQVHRCVEALVAGGVDCIELPIVSLSGLTAFAQVRAAYGESLCLGAGSVFNAELATMAFGMDVDFISGPGSDASVVRVCKVRDVLPFPGAMTPSEVIRAWHSGADLIKILPADVLGVAYFQHLRHQIPGAELAAAGGVNETNVASFIRVGAAAVVVGRGLLGEARPESADYGAITARAQRLLAVVADSRH